MGAEVCLLAVRDRAVDEREPIVELLWRLDGLFGMKGMGSLVPVREEVGSGRTRAATEFVT